MNLVLVILLMSFSWILFSQLNEIRSANEGCCKTNSCGKSGFDNMMWISSLIFSIVFTLFMLYKFFLIYTDVYMNKGKGVVQVMEKAGTELMFG